MLSLAIRVYYVYQVFLLSLVTLTILANISAIYDFLTSCMESQRNIFLGWYGILSFETALFATVATCVSAVVLDENVPRFQALPTDVVLTESIPVTTLSLFLLLVVTWFSHAVLSIPYQTVPSTRTQHPVIASTASFVQRDPLEE